MPGRDSNRTMGREGTRDITDGRRGMRSSQKEDEYGLDGDDDQRSSENRTRKIAPVVT